MKKRVDYEPIKDMSHVNLALAEISSLNRGLREIEAELNSDIDRLKRVAESKAFSLQKRLKQLEDGLAAYGEFNRDLFKDRRSVEVLFGSIGFRRSTELRPGEGGWKRVLTDLKRLAFTEAVRFKEEPNKEEMEGWPEERLKLVGVVRRVKDVFFYETKEESVK